MSQRTLDKITPELLLKAYSIGLFPMADSATDPDLFWVDPDRRAIFPLDDFHLSRSLAKTIRSDKFDVRVDFDFDAVIDACAAPAQGREQTWINEEIYSLYKQLFQQGAVHTVECWRAGQLVGGLYGVALRGAFFGESMFHRETDASKVALAHLVARLKAGRFHLLDTQFMTNHLASLGAIDISRDDYLARLKDALEISANFYAWPPKIKISGAMALSAIAQSI